MRYYGKAKETAEKIVKAFETGDIPKPLAQCFIKRDVPMSAWSTPNQFLCHIAGCSDARGFRQWNAVGRKVKKGERAMSHILVPLLAKEDRDDPDSPSFIYGFRSIPVFDVSQTEGADLDYLEEEESFVAALPLIPAAERLGLSISTYDGRNTGYLGLYSDKQQLIALGVKNVSTWLHELIHAADDRLGNLKEKGNHWRSECVAELGGATLAVLLGDDGGADVGGCWEYVSRYAETAGIQPITACTRVLDRTAQAISLILEIAEDETAAPLTAV